MLTSAVQKREYASVGKWGGFAWRLVELKVFGSQLLSFQVQHLELL